ncbi:ABC transporter ATP-binding protein [Helicobacter cetorum]|uniref:ABC transporter ATP-binding protein n=1 Tax=Helicobacter cetorum (strain ATCC BAA-429 / MIT 00-7128) TaxID=182217 RepID=I0ELK0_HELC0|nr:ABC transporter ATP-binding protein [Helicobacter cetorum]AFI03819.1 ABC transporter ATP-binding protein [Helicobacter cetorum MIT 00-7128]
MLVEIENLSKSYGSLKALDNISLKLPKKQFIGLLGPNGAGKTTLLKILAGLNLNYQGKVKILGKSIGIETKKSVAFLSDGDFLDPESSPLKAIAFYKDFFNDFDESKALDLLKHFCVPLTRKFKALSKGMREKLQLILTLSRDSSLYLFDEPVAGIDPIAREEIFELIANEFSKNASLLVSTHLVVDVEKYLDSAIFLKEGKIMAFGNIETLKNNHSSLEMAYKAALK